MFSCFIKVFSKINNSYLEKKSNYILAKTHQRSNLIIGNPFTQQQVWVCICAKPPSLCTICAHGEGVSSRHLICCVVASSCVVRELNKHRTRCARVPWQSPFYFEKSKSNRGRKRPFINQDQNEEIRRKWSSARNFSRIEVTRPLAAFGVSLKSYK